MTPHRGSRPLRITAVGRVCFGRTGFDAPHFRKSSLDAALVIIEAALSERDVSFSELPEPVRFPGWIERNPT
jgi:hypothetical protein